MEFLSTRMGGSWRRLDPADASESPELKQQVQEARETLGGFLVDTLSADNLVVLTGLGTSMCVKDKSGKSVAPSLVDLWNDAQSHTPDFKKILQLVKFDIERFGPNLESLLSRCHLAQEMSPVPRLEVFIRDTERLVIERCGFVDESVSLSTHEAFIRVLARRSPRKLRLKLFTLNYDLCFEAAASRTRFVAIDGFSHTQPQQFDSDYFSYDIVRRDDERPAPDYISNVFHLYKLHGSVDWGRVGSQVIREAKPDNPVIIYPRSTKFEASYSPPFIEMIARFQAALRHPNTGLLIIGFGFRDEHITQPFLSAIRSNVGLRAVVVSKEVDDAPGTPIGSLVRLINDGDRRLALVKGLFEDLVPMIPDLSGPTESELHAERIRVRGSAL